MRVLLYLLGSHGSQACPDVLRRRKGQKGQETLVGAQAGPLALETRFCCLSLQSIYTLWHPRHSWDPQGCRGRQISAEPEQ